MNEFQNSIGMKTRPVFVIACTLLFLQAGCKQQVPTNIPDAAKANLKVEAVHAQSVGSTIELPGRVEADPAHLVHIYAPLSGRLMNLSLTPGQEVHKGQTIAMLQSGEVGQARAEFAKASIESLRADRALERGKLMIAHEVMSQADFQELTAIDDAAHAEQLRTRQRVHELGFSESGTTDVTIITAPISGTVLEVGTASGEMQRSLETTAGIATVANLDTVWITGDLFERDLGSVHLHEPVEVTFPAYPGETLHGTIANIGDALDPATHAIKLRVVLANPVHRLKPAMFANLRISGPITHRIVLSTAAVLHMGDVTQVYVQTAPAQYALRRVTVGAIHGNQIQILDGLHEGDLVVTEGAAFLRQPVGD